MQVRPQVLVLLAMLAGAPATIVGIVLLPWALMIGMYSLAEAPLEALGYLGLGAAGIFSLSNYWLLAARSLKDQHYSFGWNFRLAALAAIALAVVVFFALPLLAAALVVIPIGLATSWFVARQRGSNLTLRSSEPPSAAAEL